MKLAEALAERKSLFAKVSDLTGRLRANATVQEGEAPTEQPAALRAELDAAVERLAVLIKAINRTNVATRLEDGHPSPRRSPIAICCSCARARSARSPAPRPTAPARA
jgi:hypothetical protein